MLAWAWAPCERACPFDAIHIDPIKQIAVVDEEKCQACKKCVAACPQHVLSMRPAGRVVNVGCHNPEKGIALKENAIVPASVARHA